MNVLRWLSVVVLLAAFAAPALCADEGPVALTVYNDGNAIVKETRTIDVPAGTGEVRLENVAKTIDPTSVKFRSLDDPNGTTILEQNYEYDLVSAGKLLEKYIGNQVSVTTADGFHQGMLMSYDGSQLVLSQGENGPLSIVTRGENVKAIEVGTLPEGLIMKPTLMWLLSSARGGRQRVEVAYNARNVSWQADYIAVLDEDDTALDLSGWVTMTNNSGKTYNDAALKLMAGEVHRVEDRRGGLGGGRVMMAAREMAAPQFEEKAFAEYHLYTLPRPTTIKDNQIKQIELLSASGVDVEKKYMFDPLRDFRPWWSGPMTDDSFSVGQKGDVRVFIIFKNDEKSNLGMPLPAGRLRLFKYDDDDLEFVGEDSIDHTPKDEKVELLMGNAFDIVGERTRTNFTRPRADRNRMEESFEIKVRNHKEETVTVHVREHLLRWLDWEITETSMKYDKLDAQTIEYPVTLAPDEEATVTYTVRYEW